MDGQRFDALTRCAAAARSRRQMLKTVGGGALVSALVGLGVREAVAQAIAPAACTGIRQRCSTNAECCGDGKFICDRISRDCANNRLRKKQRCCGKLDARCSGDCDCCRGFFCDTTEGRNQCAKS